MSWESYALGPTKKREGLRSSQFIALLTALTLLAGLLMFVAVHLIGVSEKLASIESQLRTVDFQLRRVDGLATASMVAQRDPPRIKELQSPDMDVSRIDSRLSLLQSSIGGFGPGESIKSKLDELKSQLAYCRRL